MGDGREGDWECSSCNNRNYAFRSFCNRCKQPRLLVDAKTPAHSKWLPRIGDWICTGCTNNNYASREKCNKCGQPKEIAAMPAIAITGASLPTYTHYFSRGPAGGSESKMNVLRQPLLLTSTRSDGGDVDNYGLCSLSSWPLGGNQILEPLYANQPLSVAKGWRNGDWICNCGFHNYSSRAQCKKCYASIPPALGTKRLASEDFAQDLENKRLNLGNINGQQQTYPGFDHILGTIGIPRSGMNAPYPSLGLGVAPNWQSPIQFPHQVTTPALLGKGAKQWRNGDWMCTNCSNHNYASRSQCNRCKTFRDRVVQPVDAV
ncbi:ranBP2-type zinc finger protein At1g67325 isoform X2 [Mercurialis annua]|uniref:ranBP2-type zinc finger protein At1g67325 isoform X2 n=1 Tax=Mercurialis annua TaxID=3986 RepID=UPI00215F821F|nr:ranBP2-type zinc finger protein At1g67325 isoform X2 [Mercurialis annua]